MNEINRALHLNFHWYYLASTLQTETKTKNKVILMSHKSRIKERLLKFSKETLSPSTSKLWKQWLEKTQPGIPDLVKLVEADFRPEFQARAITVLLVNNSELLPFRWKEDFSIGPYLALRDNGLSDLMRLSEEMISLIGDLIACNVHYVLNNENKRDYYPYGNLICSFLAVLPEDHPVAKRLYDCYQLRDPVTYYNPDEASGYNPYYQLLSAKGVPTSWKRTIDKQMRVRVRQEWEGELSPREDWECAVDCYVQHLRDACILDNLAYDRDLFVSQLHFILDLPGFESYENSYIFSRILKESYHHIQENPFTSLRRKLIRQAMAGIDESDYFGFTITNDEDLKLTELILKDIQKADDLELVAHLSYMIDQYEREKKERAVDKKVRARESEAVLASMK